MKDANPRNHLNRLITDRNYLGAQLYLRESELDSDERNELLGVLATAVVDELSRTRREDRERLAYLRSVLAWILREVPGLGTLYREQLRASQGGTDLLSEVSRGIRNIGDVAAGRKGVREGFEDATEDARRTFEGAADRVRSGESADRVNDFLSAAERGIRDGLDQLGSFFRSMNDSDRTRSSDNGDSSDRSGPTAAEKKQSDDTGAGDDEESPGRSTEVEDAEIVEDSAENDR